MKELLRRIRDNNILLEVVDGKLQVFTVDTEIDPVLLADIKTRKDELLRFLADNQQDTWDDSFANSIPAAPRQESYPLSSAQRRLWLLSQSASASQAYHMAKSFRLQGELDEAAFEHAFNQLIARHESLRTVFREIEPGQVRQMNSIFPSGSQRPRSPVLYMRSPAMNGLATNFSAVSSGLL